MNMCRSLLAATLLAMVSIAGPLTAENGVSVMTFYTDASAEAFQRIVEEEIPQAPDAASTVIAVWVQQVCAAHPEYITQLDLSKLPIRTQQLLLAGLRSVDTWSPVMEQLDTPENRIAADRIEITPAGAWDKFVVSDSDDLDLLWASFFATGDKKYINQVLEAITRDEQALLVAHELENREALSGFLNEVEGQHDHTDLLERVERLLETRPDFLDQVVIAKAGMWSLNSIAEQDPRVGEIAAEMMKEDPSIDFRARINKALDLTS